MNPISNWRWPHSGLLSYCVKVTIATLLGYVLALGGPESAVYSAMSAALIVGASRGEDVVTSTNRVRGTLAGMLVGICLTYVPLPVALAVATGVGTTAYVCLAFRWGVPAARVGMALCTVMILVHAQDAIQYSLVRVGNTLIGIVAGLTVSYLVLTVRGRDAVAHAADASLTVAGVMLARLASAKQPLPVSLHVGMLDRVLELEKAVRDGRKEFGRDNDGQIETARHVALVCAGTLTAAIAHTDLCKNSAALVAASSLLSQAGRLALRAQALTPEPVMTSQVKSAANNTIHDMTVEDAIALQGFALGLRKIELGLAAMQR